MMHTLLLGILTLITGVCSDYWGHTWITRGNDKIYALRSLDDSSSLMVYSGKEISASALIGEFKTPGRQSCHITLLDRQAIVSDYSSGTLTLFDLDAAGIPCTEARIIPFATCSHIHSSWISPDGTSVVVADLGTSCIYRFQIAEGRLLEGGYETFQLPAGCGPRHCAFGRDKLYVSTELSDEVLVLSWPEMELLQRLIANPVTPHGGSHIALSADGRFVYMSCRLENDGIAVFSVGADGLLTLVGYSNTGSHPRHFSISADGRTLAVACRDSNEIEYFKINKKTGLLVKKSEESIEKPVFVDF